MQNWSKRILGACIATTLLWVLMGCAAHKVNAPTRSESEQIVDRYIEASGGRAQLEGITDSTMEGSVMVVGMTMKFVDQRKGTFGHFAQATLGNNVFFEQITNAEKGFTKVQGQKTVSSDDEITKGWRFAYWPELEYDKRAVKSVLTATEDVNGQQAHKVEYQYGEGDTSVSWYLVDSGLKVKEQSTRAGALQTVVISDYREVDGVMLPFSVSIKTPMQIEIKAKTFTLNQNLKDDLFKVE